MSILRLLALAGITVFLSQGFAAETPDTDGDGALSKEEVEAASEADKKKIAKLDADKNGELSKEEFAKWDGAKKKKKKDQ